MCGINGIFAYHYAANPIDRSELIRTRDHMANRGPDAAGDWVSDDSRIGFGHRRLAIIDLSEGGAQPMQSADGRYVVTFNGEIYNYSALRDALIARGRIFKSQSDTEVLLHLYAEEGAAMVNSLRGMFAFAIYDCLARTLFLARDPYGIKPLYYADDGWTFRFASQVKALLVGGQVSRDPEPAGLAGFYLWGSVPEPFTIYRSIRMLPAGHTVLVTATGTHEPVSYCSIAGIFSEADSQIEQTPASLQQDQLRQVHAALLDSVKHHLVADVPVGLFLSAGIDSGALLSLMREAGQESISAVTLAFDEFLGQSSDEAPLAAEIAKKFDVNHVVRRVTKREFDQAFPDIIAAMDQPSIDGINTWFVSKAAHEVGLKVAISGLGGDELFGGYPSFRTIPTLVRFARLPSRVPLVGSCLRRLLMPAARANWINPKAAGVVELGGRIETAYLLQRGLFLPWEIKESFACAQDGLRRLNTAKHITQTLAQTCNNSFGKIATLEASLYMRNQLLRDTDWASMAHGLEVRVPLVDITLLKALAPTLLKFNSMGKRLLGNSLTARLPDAVLNRPKTGFLTPIAEWQKTSELALRAGRKARKEPWARTWATLVAAS